MTSPVLDGLQLRMVGVVVAGATCRGHFKEFSVFCLVSASMIGGGQWPALTDDLRNFVLEYRLIQAHPPIQLLHANLPPDRRPSNNSRDPREPLALHVPVAFRDKGLP